MLLVIGRIYVLNIKCNYLQGVPRDSLGNFTLLGAQEVPDGARVPEPHTMYVVLAL